MIFLIDRGFDMEEIWKNIKEEPNYYISNFGRIKDSNNNIKSYHYDKDKYIIVSLNNKHYKVHRLVALYFVDNPNPDIYTIINHKDENKQNNVYNNLEWCDKKYNTNYGTNIKRIANSLSKERIVEYDINGNITNIYRSLSYVHHNVNHGAAIHDAIYYNYYNRFYDNKYYFLETEKFNSKRKGVRRIYYLYHKNDLTTIICKGDRRKIANHIHIGVKQFANYINYYSTRNKDIVVLDYVIKIELV